MTGNHIRCVNDKWEYPNHEELLKKCKLAPMETYVERRRGTLWEYLEKYRKDLLREARKITPHNKNVRKILWWNQQFIGKREMRKNNF